MVGIGTIINTFAVILGGILGYVFQRLIPTKIQNTVLKAIGLGVIFIGISGTLSKMLVISQNHISTTGEIMLILSLALGTIVGELIDIDQKFINLGNFLQSKFSKENNSKFSEGFILSSLTVCVGAMAIVGSLQDGLNHDPSILITKSLIDFIVVLLFATTYGIGCSFAALPVFIFEGGITLLAVFIKPLMTTEMLNAISLVGNSLIVLIGVNMLLNQKIKVSNMLPALIITVIYIVLT